MKKIVAIHDAIYEPIADLKTYRALPTASIRYLDPFIFLNHHGPQFYPPKNHGVPFGPHPHRGFETVTFILDGEIYHKDSGGHQGTLLPGGVQWMTAGSGLIHSEVSSEKFKERGGNLELLQLWVNLPARHKLAKPQYIDLQKENIPIVKESGEEVMVHVISGAWHGTEGAYQSISDIHLVLIEMQPGSTLSTSIDPSRNIFFYVVKGKLMVNERKVTQMQLVEFENEESEIKVEAMNRCILLLGHGLPYNEPVVSQGPFVMNTQEEILQAFEDYHAGKMGVLN
jgi:redox-sensitive bicupin YhaK (pirin superfamily)